MADWSAWMGMTPNKNQGASDDAPVEASELYDAGVHIPKGDPRLQSGITLKNLNDTEKAQLINHRKKNN